MKNLIALLCLFPTLCFSQMTQNNEPTYGTNTTMFLCDSNVTKYANLVGSNQTWDYSNIAGIGDPSNLGHARTKLVSLDTINPNTTDTVFIGANKKYSIGSSIKTFYSSTPTQRISQGYIFFEQSLGDVYLNWTAGTNPNSEILNEYPFALNGFLTDNYSGAIKNTTFLATPAQASGNASAQIDGSGTLKLPGNTYSNVLRYHLKDSSTTSVFGQNISFVRDIYEYYDYSMSNFPIFIILNSKVYSLIVNNNSTIVLSKDEPTHFVGIEEKMLSNIKIYPNPVKNSLYIDLKKDFEYKIKSVDGLELIKGGNSSTIDVSTLPVGVYLIEIAINTDTSTLRFIKE